MNKMFAPLLLVLSVTGMSLVGCGAHYEKPRAGNYYHCVYKNKNSNKTFSANASSMKAARSEARTACHSAGQSKACRVSYCRYVH